MVTQGGANKISTQSGNRNPEKNNTELAKGKCSEKLEWERSDCWPCKRVAHNQAQAPAQRMARDLTEFIPTPATRKGQGLLQTGSTVIVTPLCCWTWVKYR